MFSVIVHLQNELQKYTMLMLHYKEKTCWLFSPQEAYGDQKFNYIALKCYLI